MHNLPKILFIADEIPQSIHAGSIQFFRLFKEHPSEKIMIFGRKPVEGAEILQCQYHVLEMPLMDKLRSSRFRSYLTDLQSLGFALPTLPNKLKKIADEFKPDVVISLMQLLPFYYMAYQYARRRYIPFLLFCHDDAEDFAKPHRFFLKRLVSFNAKIYQSASKRLCISPEMAEAWEEKYQAKGDFLYPIASENIKSRYLKKAEHLVNENNLTIGYAGSLAYGYKEGINEIIPVLEKAGAKLKIFRNVDNDIIKSRSIEFAGYAKTPEETWNRIIKECDAVILPYSTNKSFEKLYSTHFPSKLPEYLKLQMPIIVNGPIYANGIRFAKQNIDCFSCAISPEELELSLKNLLSSSYRANYCKNSSIILKKYFENNQAFL